MVSRTSEWFGRFRDGKESVVDDDRNDHPFITRTVEKNACIAALLKKDRRITYHLTAGRLNISKSIVQRILKDLFSVCFACANK